MATDPTTITALVAISKYFGLTVKEMKVEKDKLSRADIDELAPLCAEALGKTLRPATK